MRSTAAVVALVALVALSGCLSSTFGGSTPAGGETELSLSEVEFPDGVSGDEVNVSRLLESHSTGLESENYTFHLTYELDRNAGGGEDVTMDVRVAAGSLPRRATLNSSVQRVDLYVDEETAYQRRTADGETSYEMRPRTPEALSMTPISPTGASLIRQFANPVNFTPTGARIEDGTRLVVLTGESVTADVGANVTDLDATMLVDERGVVHEVTMTLTASGDDGGTIRLTYDLSAVGNTAVTPPDWLDEARDAADG